MRPFRREYLAPTPLSWIEEMLRAKTQRGERYTMQDAVQSLLLDRLRETDHSKVTLARWWGWSRSQLYELWSEIEAQAERQRTFYSAERKAKTNGKTPGHLAGHAPNILPDTEVVPNHRNQHAEGDSTFETGHSPEHSSDTASDSIYNRAFRPKEQSLSKDNNNNPQRYQQEEPQPVVVVGLEGWIERLVGYGVNEPAARRFLKKPGVEVIKRQIEHLEMLVRQGKSPTQPAGWLVTAIKEDYPVSSAKNVETVAVLSYSEAIAEYQRLTGGGSPTNPFDRYFEKVPGGFCRIKTSPNGSGSKDD